MLIMPKSLSIFFLGIFFSLASFFPTMAQQEAEFPYKAETSISVTPQYLLSSGMKLGLTFPVVNKINTISVNTVYYLGTTESENLPDDENPPRNVAFEGYGVDLMHKVFYHHANTSADLQTGFYFGHGPRYRHFDITFRALDWISFQEAGYTFYEFGLADQKKTIDQYNYVFVNGVEFKPKELLMVDFYFGVAMKYSKTSTTHSNAPSYNENIWSFGYNGPTFVTGMKLGVILP